MITIPDARAAVDGFAGATQAVAGGACAALGFAGSTSPPLPSSTLLLYFAKNRLNTLLVALGFIISEDLEPRPLFEV